MRTVDTPVIVNLYGNSLEEYGQMASQLKGAVSAGAGAVTQGMQGFDKAMGGAAKDAKGYRKAVGGGANPNTPGLGKGKESGSSEVKTK